MSFDFVILLQLGYAAHPDGGTWATQFSPFMLVSAKAEPTSCLVRAAVGQVRMARKPGMVWTWRLDVQVCWTDVLPMNLSLIV